MLIGKMIYLYCVGDVIDLLVVLALHRRKEQVYNVDGEVILLPQILLKTVIVLRYRKNTIWEAELKSTSGEKTRTRVTYNFKMRYSKKIEPCTHIIGS